MDPICPDGKIMTKTVFKGLLVSVCILVLSSGTPSQAAPLHGNAHEILEIIKQVVQREGKQELTPEEFSRVMGLRNNGQFDFEVAYALLWLPSGDAAMVMHALDNGADPHNQSVEGMKRTVSLVKQTSILPPQQRLAILSFYLGRETSHVTRVFIAAELGREFGSVVVPIFLELLKKEPVQYVRAELYYQIANWGTPDQLLACQSLVEKEEEVQFDRLLSEMLNIRYHHKPMERDSFLPIQQQVEVVIRKRSESKSD